MNKFKRISFLSLILLAVSSLMVYALPSSLQRVTRMFSYIFFNLKATSVFPVFLKFSYFIIVFAVLYNGGLLAFKSQGENSPMRRAVAIIAFIIALTSAIFIPYKLLLYIFKLYSVILSILFALLPMIIGFFVNQYLFNQNTRSHHILRALVYLLIAILTFAIVGVVEADSSPDTQIYRDFTDYLAIGAVVCIVAGIINLLLALGGGAAEAGSTVRSWFGGAPAPPAGPAPPGGPTPPGGPAPGPTPAADPAVVADLTNRMGQFIARVTLNTMPNPGIYPLSEGLNNAFETEFQNLFVGPASPPPRTPASIRTDLGANYGTFVSIAQDILARGVAPALAQCTHLRDEMQEIYTRATTSNQYNDVQEGVRQQYEQAVVQFLTAEAQLTQLSALIGAL